MVLQWLWKLHCKKLQSKFWDFLEAKINLLPFLVSVCTSVNHSFSYIYFYWVTIVCIFSPSLHPTSANPTSLPHLYPPPWFCPCVLYSSAYRPLSPLPPPHSPLAIVTLFLISMSLVIFCLLFSFVDYVPGKGEIIWYLSLTTWLISLSIMLSSSIHAIAKQVLCKICYLLLSMPLFLKTNAQIIPHGLLHIAWILLHI